MIPNRTAETPGLGTCARAGFLVYSGMSPSLAVRPLIAFFLLVAPAWSLDTPESAEGPAGFAEAPAALDGAPVGGKRYGVIINGDDNPDPDSWKKHRGNALAYARFMKDRYGIAEGDIKILSITNVEEGKLPEGRFNTGDIRALAGMVKDARELVIYVTGHGSGNKEGKNCSLVLPQRTQIDSKVFAEMFLDNEAESVVFLGDQCYSGGFARDMTTHDKAARKKVIAISATDSCTKSECQEFLPPYLAAFKKDATINECDAFRAARAQYVKKRKCGKPQYMTTTAVPAAQTCPEKL